MTDQQTLYLSEVILASSFYYGIAGGAVGYLALKASGYIFRRVLSLCQWR